MRLIKFKIIYFCSYIYKGR